MPEKTFTIIIPTHFTTCDLATIAYMCRKNYDSPCDGIKVYLDVYMAPRFITFKFVRS